MSLDIKKIIIMIILFWGNFLSRSLAQDNWAKTYGGSKADEGIAISQAADGNYFILGTTESFGLKRKSIWLLKIDASGNVLWQKIYGSNYPETPAAFHATPDGGCIIVGSISYNSPKYDEALIMKVDARGKIEWQNAFGYANGNAEADSVDITNDGNYIAAIFASSSVFWILKIDPTGSIIWQKSFFPQDYWHSPVNVMTVSDGYIITSPEGIPWPAGAYYTFIMKLDNKGKALWKKITSTSSWDFTKALASAHDGGIILIGNFVNSMDSFPDFFVMKFDQSGNLSWTKYYSTGEMVSNYSIYPASDSGYVIASQRTDGIWIGKIDESGSILWERIYKIGSNDKANSIYAASEGGYLIAGTTSNNSDSDIWILKLDSAGNIGKSCPYVFPSSTFALSLARSSSDFSIPSGNPAISSSNASLKENSTSAGIDTQCEGYAPGFTISCNPSSVLYSKHIADCTITPVHGFTGDVNLDCINLPPGVRCHFSPATVKITGEASASSRLGVWDFTLLSEGIYPFLARASGNSHTSTFTLQLIREKEFPFSKNKIQ